MNRYNKIKIIGILSVLFGVFFTSCEKYLDITPKGKLIISSTQDYNDMMADPKFSSYLGYLDFMCSDNTFINPEVMNSFVNDHMGKAYLWKDQFLLDTEDDPTWNQAYQYIFNYNLVIDNIMEAKGGTEAEKKRILYEAKINRAYTYFVLNMLYAPAYNKQSASTDVSVPLMTHPNFDIKPSRATVSEIINQILDDLKDADTYLPEKGATPYRISKMAAHALAARVYVYISDFEKAAEHANKALSYNSRLIDYNTYKFPDALNPSYTIINKPQNLLSPEVLLYRSSSIFLNTNFCMSKELQEIYMPEDLRYKFFFSRIKENGEEYDDKYPPRYIQQMIDNSISVPEIMLIKAECMARKGDVGCLNVLQDLRAKRFAPADLKPLTGSSPAELLKLVIDERQRELVYQNLRWYDMKRLAKEGVYTKTLVREYENKKYTLEPNSNKYVFPISSKLIKINPNITPNPR